MAETVEPAGPLSGRTAWARNLEAPVRDFLRTETGSAAILFGATLVALAWVNIDPASYETVWHTVLSIRLGNSGMTPGSPSLDQRRLDDVLLLRRRPRGDGVSSTSASFVIGRAGAAVDRRSLRDDGSGSDLPRVQCRQASIGGWGTAMSTDTAFALGMLTLVGRRFPNSLRTFILTVAVVDDLIALIVIGTAYTVRYDRCASDWRFRLRAGCARPLAADRQRRCLRRAWPDSLGCVSQIRGRSGRRRARNGPADDRLSGSSGGP